MSPTGVPEKQPDWFTKYSTLYDKDKNESEERDQSILDSVDSLRDDARNRVHNDFLREKLVTYTDTCELVVHGLPPIFADSLYDASKKLLTALRFGIDHDLPSIIETRKWISAHPQNSSQNSTTNSSQQPDLSSPFVFQVGSPLVRDKILSRANILKNQNARTIFGVGGSTPVYIHALWPKPVHELFIEAVKASKMLNYARPIVKNLRVCMRKTLRAELVPILSPNDLSSFPPHQVQTQEINNTTQAEEMSS